MQDMLMEDILTEKFILFCEYTHCCGKQRVMLGEAAGKGRAEAWVIEQKKKGRRPRLDEKDLVLTCPVNHCPAKRQSPRYDFYPENPLNITYNGSNTS